MPRQSRPKASESTKKLILLNFPLLYMRVTIVYNRRRDAVAPLLIKYYKLGVATVKSALPFPDYNFNAWITCADLV